MKTFSCIFLNINGRTLLQYSAYRIFGSKYSEGDEHLSIGGAWQRSRYDKGHFRHCPGYSCFCYILLKYVIFEQKLVFQVDISIFLHFGAKRTKTNEKSPISGKIQYLLHCNIKIYIAFTLRTYSDVPINRDNRLIGDYLQNFWLSIPIFIID